MDRRSLLFGRDETPGIVSITADRHGHARVWRRVDGRVLCEEDVYPNWMLLSRRTLLSDVPLVEADPEILLDLESIEPSRITLVQLRGDHHFKHLALTRD